MKCKYLEHQICTRSDGQYRLCCTSFEDDNKETIYTHTPQQWHDSDFHRGVREQLDRDEWPDACIKCAEQEEAGLESMRTKVKEDGTRYVRNHFGPGLSHWDLRFGNSCNLRCISCFHLSSSSLAEEAIAMQKAGVQPLHMPLLDEPNFNWVTEETLKHFENVPDMKEVYLTGGEPMMVKHLPGFLDRLDPTVCVRFNTNGTLWNPKVSKILKKFRTVIMSMSIDAVDHKIDYIRHGSDWDIISENTQRYAEFCTVDVTPTTSVLNAIYDDEIREYCAKNRFKIYDNLLITPTWLHVKNAPDELKKKFTGNIAKWADVDADPEWQNKFREYITKLDNFRGMHIKDYLPEVAKAYGLN